MIWMIWICIISYAVIAFSTVVLAMIFELYSTRFNNSLNCLFGIFWIVTVPVYAIYKLGEFLFLTIPAFAVEFGKAKIKERKRLKKEREELEEKRKRNVLGEASSFRDVPETSIQKIPVGG